MFISIPCHLIVYAIVSTVHEDENKWHSLAFDAMFPLFCILLLISKKFQSSRALLIAKKSSFELKYETHTACSFTYSL